MKAKYVLAIVIVLCTFMLCVSMLVSAIIVSRPKQEDRYERIPFWPAPVQTVLPVAEPIAPPKKMPEDDK